MNGMPFMQTAHAVDVTRLGARLVDLFCLPEIGEITIQHGNQKARYKIAWTGTMGGAEAGQVGLRLLEPEKNIWGKSLSKRAPRDDAEDAPEEGPHHRPTPPKNGSGGVAAVVAAAPVYAHQRMHPRYAAHAATEVLPDGGTKSVWATLTKISASGFYAETPSPLPTDIPVNVTLRTLVGQIRANGITRSSHPNAGMGIGFINLNDEDRNRLGRFIEQVMKTSDPTFGLGLAMIEAVEPDRTQPIPEPPRLPKKAAAPALSPEKIAENSKLTARLHSLIKELRELQEAVNSAGLDHRVTRAFQNSVTHTHQNAEYLAQWLRSANEGKDPYPVIVEVNAERVRIAAEQARELVIDIDAMEIEHSTQGLEKLTSAITALHKRLTNLLKQ
jgi:PilZ domain-containing protein